jgi:methionine aminopeptidase
MYAVNCDTAGVRDEAAVDAKARELIEVTRGAVAAAISACGPKVPLATIGSAITKYVAEVSERSDLQLARTSQFSFFCSVLRILRLWMILRDTE